MRISDWSSDVCSSDLQDAQLLGDDRRRQGAGRPAQAPGYILRDGCLRGRDRTMTALTALAQMPPGLVLILGGMLLPALPRGLRQLAVLALPLLCLALVWQVPAGTVLSFSFLGHEVAPVQGDALSRLFATVF